MCEQVKNAYINFLNHCYIDTEVEMKEIYTSNHMWMLFENFLIDMAMVSGTSLKDESGVVCTDYCQFEITAMTWIAQYEKLAS